MVYLSSKVTFLDLTEGSKELNTSRLTILFLFALSAFTPVDLSDLKKRNTQDSKKS